MSKWSLVISGGWFLFVLGLFIATVIEYRKPWPCSRRWARERTVGR